MIKRDAEKGLDTMKKLKDLENGKPTRYGEEEKKELNDYFSSSDFDKKEFLNELSIRINEGFIKTDSGYGDDQLIEKDETKKLLLYHLKNGQVYLTDYGKTYVEIYCEFKPYIETQTNNINSKIKQLEEMQNNLFFQIIGIMGIFIAILAFIFQGISLITKSDFITLSFNQQLLTGFGLYIPLGLILFFIFLLSIFLYWFVIFIRKWSRDQHGRKKPGA
jgi:hypothetical protein